MISLAAIGSGIANNPLAQRAIGVALIIAGFLFWLARHDRKLLENERLQQEREALKKDQAIRANSNEAVEAADTVRSNTERLSTSELRDEPSGDYHYRD